MTRKFQGGMFIGKSIPGFPQRNADIEDSLRLVFYQKDPNDVKDCYISFFNHFIGVLKQHVLKRECQPIH